MANDRNFRELLDARMAEGKFVCVGLDAQHDHEKVQDAKQNKTVREGGYHNPDKQFNFCMNVIEQTKDVALAFKPNLSFFSNVPVRSVGHHSIDQLRLIILQCRELAPEVPVILDCKFGDIGNTNAGYAGFVFDRMGADAVTVHNYMGMEAMRPFLDRREKGVFVLCKTSNEGSGEFQNQRVIVDTARLPRGFTTQYVGKDAYCVPLYQLVAYNVASSWNYNGNCGLVVGATYPEELYFVRCIVGDGFPILIPGIGAQGGEVEATVRAGRDSNGSAMVINSSRGIIFADDPGKAAQELHQQISDCRMEGQKA